MRPIDAPCVHCWINTAAHRKWFDGYKNLYKTLARISNAKRIRIDCWRATLSAADAACFDRLPHSMEPSPDGTSVRQTYGTHASSTRQHP